jgi:hypothetical protein
LDERFDPHDGPAGAMRFVTDKGFATVSTALVALPASGHPDRRPVFRFKAHQPEPLPWRDILPGATA